MAHSARPDDEDEATEIKGDDENAIKLVAPVLEDLVQADVDQKQSGGSSVEQVPLVVDDVRTTRSRNRSASAPRKGNRSRPSAAKTRGSGTRGSMSNKDTGGSDRAPTRKFKGSRKKRDSNGKQITDTDPRAPDRGNRSDSRLRRTSSGPNLREVNNSPPVAKAHSGEDARIYMRRQTNSTSSAALLETPDRAAEKEGLKVRLAEAEAKHQLAEARCWNLMQSSSKLEGDLEAKKAELTAFKAEVRSKSIAVGKAEMTLNEVCLAMADNLGRADGAQVSANKGRVLQEVHESPAEFAAQVKKSILLQLAKWEIDRAALEAQAARAGDEAAVAAKVRAEERADLTGQSEELEGRIRQLEGESAQKIEEAELLADQTQATLAEEITAKEALRGDLENATRQIGKLRQELVDNEREFQAQLDRFMDYPKAAEDMAEKLDKCLKSSRREHNLVELERKEFRRQLQTFMRWQTENGELRKHIKLQGAQVLALRRQLAMAEASSAGCPATRKAVVGGAVDRLQRAAASAKHQANKYRELAGSRGLKVTELEKEIKALKATVQRMQDLQETHANESYEMEIGRLARTSPDILEYQQKAGLTREDMQASLAKLKALREKEDQKNALVNLVRERDEFELCVKDLRARNSWLEKQLLGTPGALRSVAAERVSAVAETEHTEAIIQSWVRPGVGSRPGSAKSDVVSRLEQRLELREKVAASGGPVVDPESTASIRRKIQFLEDCDRSIEKQRERDAVAYSRRIRKSGGGSGVAAVRSKQRPHSAQSGRTLRSAEHRRGSISSIGCGLFRRRSGVGGRRRVSQDDSGVFA